MSKTNNPNFKKIAFYIISTKNKSKKNIFKIGIHTGSVYTLLSRYVTYFMNPVVHYFQYINEAANIEKKLKKELYDHRLENIFGNKSEWVKMPYKLLYEHVKSYIVYDYNIVVDKYNSIDLSKKNFRRKLSNKKEKHKSISIFNSNTKENIIDIMTSSDENSENSDAIISHKNIFINKLGINNINNDELRVLLNLYLGKEYLFDRYETLFGYNKISNLYDDPQTIKNERIKRKIIIDFVNRLLGEKNNNYLDDLQLDNIIIKHKKYNKAIQDIINNSIYFNDENKYRPFFSTNHKHIDNNHNIQYYTSTIIRRLSEYNIILKVESRKKKGGISTYTYSLSVDKQVKDIICNKFITTR
ncbi:helicase [Moumouvirus australiensis]|uniref:Helicase n=1 Tax=Moumouvirus australiensis TaxID=2109587 RepID=A0A2P1EN35_9VIRU|nr:helicase [Moumouvirus australiensis]YP_010790215.1 helicase [Moumouvirus australiensis]AVL94407.1 helicase [Moumouvirus australiensis]AVL95282.1 helicase [Moumouvirus australiensis]